MPNRTTIHSYERLIVWMQRDIRLTDNPALYHAAHDANECIPLFIIDDEYLSSSPAKQQFVNRALARLRSDLQTVGGNLVIRKGKPEEIIPQFIAECNASGVYTSVAYEPAAKRQQSLIRSRVQQNGQYWSEFKGNLLFNTNEIVSRIDAPYKIFSPFKNTSYEKLKEVPPPLSLPLHIRTPALRSFHLPEDANNTTNIELNPIKTLGLFLNKKAIQYHKDRDLLYKDGTSRISHHLSTGALSVRTVVHETISRMRESDRVEKNGLTSFLDEILWREFFYHVMVHFPYVIGNSFKSKFDRIIWDGKHHLYDAWCHGMTGYPIVDAAMRQLNSESWMHNRGRMIVASFLTKDLHIDWRMGEQYFLSKLIDGDLALNNGGWQWSAGTGTDAQPWFRIFNPVLQGKKFDPSGNYIKKYIPELASVPEIFIHEPWKMPLSLQQHLGLRVGKQYPLPIVSHDIERRRSIATYKNINYSS